MAWAVLYMARSSRSKSRDLSRRKEKEDMSTVNVPLIKAKLGFRKAQPPVVLARANLVYTGIKENPTDYPAPIPDLATFKGEIDTIAVKVMAAMDGGKQAIVERNRQLDVVVRILHKLGHYVEANCKDDMATFMKSGFEPVSTGKVVSQSLSKSIRKITHGHNSGEFHVTPAVVPGASSYEVRRAPVGADGTIATWTTQAISNTRPPTTITGLIPGTAYAFQVRALVDSKFSDWSDTVIRVCL
jgi:hypothetical protein